MSRSYKKPYYTDQQRSTVSVKSKRMANRAVRAANKKACSGQIASELPNGMAYHKASDSWSIRDYSFHCPEDKKAHRK